MSAMDPNQDLLMWVPSQALPEHLHVIKPLREQNLLMAPPGYTMVTATELAHFTLGHFKFGQQWIKGFHSVQNTGHS